MPPPNGRHWSREAIPSPSWGQASTCRIRWGTGCYIGRLLSTASQAIELGRMVAAVPGPIDSDQSRGSNQLLRDGAVLIAAPEDALALLGVSLPRVAPPTPLLPESEQKVWDAIAQGFVETDSLPASTGLTMAECLAAITSLEIIGLVECSLA